MCTVTYLPLETGFILTSNRDERLTRKPALFPAEYAVFGQTVYYPKDMEASGTWFATSTTGATICLLNGAFEKHVSKPPYLKSRGLIVLDFFRFKTLRSFVSEYDFIGIESFTLVFVESALEKSLHELRWDGEKLHLKKLDENKPKIWSSATLYTEEMVKQRQSWFKEWLQNTGDFNQTEILNFHRFGGDGDADNDLVMKRDDQKQTVSITSVCRKEAEMMLAYQDLISNESNFQRVELLSTVYFS